MIPSFLAKQNIPLLNDPDNFFTYIDAISGSNRKEWVTAMVTEMDALNRLKTWSLGTRPSDRRIVTFRWVYAVKRSITGLVNNIVPV